MENEMQNELITTNYSNESNNIGSNPLVENFLMVNAKNLPQDKIHILRERLNSIPAERLNSLSSIPIKDSVLMLVISLFFGYLGIDRLMLGEIGFGILKFITGGGCCIWTIVDWFIIMNKTKEVNFNKIMNSVY